MVQPQMDQDWFRNISSLVLVEPNRIRNLTYACTRLLFANVLMVKMSHALTVWRCKIFTWCWHDSYFPFCGWCEVWFKYEIKTQSKCYTCAESGPKIVLRPKWSDVGPESSRTSTWTCTNSK